MVDITPDQDGGVLKEILKEGTGDELPAAKSKVIVHYTGTLLDGTKFDSSKDRNKPFEFVLKENRVIKAWDIGVATMKKGEVAVLTCAPEYAYGKSGSPPKIPPNATLKFEIEMIDWEGLDLSPEKDQSIQKFELTPGKDYDNPNDGSSVEIHLTGMYDGKTFEDRDVQFSLGEGENVGVVEGVEEALKSFKKGEKSRLKIKSKFAFQNKGNSEFNIPPHADVEYIVELKNFEKTEEVWSMDGPQKMSKAKEYKEKGTGYFKQNKYNLAIKMYSKIITVLDHEPDFKDDLKERNDLLLSAHLNLALCYLKINEHIKARDSCDSALKIDPSNEKAYFRRGQAHLALISPEIALKDFNKVLEIEPKNTAAANQILVCNKVIKQQLAKEKKLYANMFDKFAKEDKQKEEEELSKQPDVMRGTLGEWGQEERPGGRDATAFEKENPNILMLNANGTGEFQNM